MDKRGRGGKTYDSCLFISISKIPLRKAGFSLFDSFQNEVAVVDANGEHIVSIRPVNVFVKVLIVTIGVMKT